MKISKANSKTGIESFNIHNKICKKLDFCKKQKCIEHCYYNKIIRIYPKQNKFLMDNYKATLRKDFVQKMNLALFKLNIRFFRIHSCGEFYNYKYFKKWMDIAKHNPEILFYTYTKNVNLKSFERPKNFILYLSDNRNYWAKYHKYFDGIAKVDLGDNNLKGFNICLHQTPAKLKCIECRMCMKKGGKIYFKMH